MKIGKRLLDKNPLARAAAWILEKMQDQIVIALILLLTGFFFLFSPSGDVSGIVLMTAVTVLIAGAANIFIHLVLIKWNWLDLVFCFLNALLMTGAIYCLLEPSTVELYFRYGMGLFTIVTNLANLIGVLKLKNKRSWRFWIGLVAFLLMTGLGFVMLFADVGVIEVLQRVIGVFLILNSITTIWYCLP